ncbi:MAG: phage holin [Clostridia bacterium]|jgi:uncharacterized membrane protein|nr:phage holin [Clostridia bacterium]
MKFKDRVKSYKFWVALSASLIILLQTLGEAFGFTISEKVIDGIVMGFCSILVVLGIVEHPADKNNDDKENIENDKKSENESKPETKSENKPEPKSESKPK